MTGPGTYSGQPLPDGWRWVRLGEICQIIAGQSPPGSTYRTSPEGFPFFQGKADFGDTNPLARVWCVEPKKMARPGDILISVRAPVGPTNVANVECCIGRGLAAIRCGSDAHRDFIFNALRHFESTLVKKGSGSTFEAINRDDLESFAIPLPPLPEQRRIAGVLCKQIAAVEKARAAAQDRLATVKALPATFLRQVFPQPGQPLPDGSYWVSLGDKATLLPSRSIASDGDSQVQAITTACLTESGFNPDGVKSARMRVRDVQDCIIAAGEVLIARSNTPELVGRACLFDGFPEKVVASDLTIRIQAHGDLLPQFLSRYLSSLFIRGYWREQAVGASGSMKKITRAQVMNLAVPLPPLSEQKHIADVLRDQMAAADKARVAAEEELATINALPAALLRRAFAGEL